MAWSGLGCGGCGEDGQEEQGDGGAKKEGGGEGQRGGGEGQQGGGATHGVRLARLLSLPATIAGEQV